MDACSYRVLLEIEERAEIRAEELAFQSWPKCRENPKEKRDWAENVKLERAKSLQQRKTEFEKWHAHEMRMKRKYEEEDSEIKIKHEEDSEIKIEPEEDMKRAGAWA